jgi:multidrug efflux pump subunit AcrB
MMASRHQPGKRRTLAQYCVEHREVSWLALIGVLIWGWLAYQSLPQQEDPTIPNRTALLVTRFPGASALKMEQLVTKKLEEKIDELECIEELTSQSRSGVSVIKIEQRPARKAPIEQEWDKLRAKLLEVTLPEGCGAPTLDTDYGNTVTLLFALTSPLVSEAETIARANLIRTRLTELRATTGVTGRAAAFAFYPPAVAESYRAAVRQKFATALAREKLGDDIKTVQGKSYILADFKTAASRGELEQFIRRFIRSLSGTEAEQHPDFGAGMVLMGGEEPLPALRRGAMPRYSYRDLEKAAERLEDELKQVPSVGRVRKIGNVSEEVDLLFSIPVLNGYNFSADDVMNAIVTRNALIPGGTFRAEGQNFPVQVSGEFQNEDELLSAIVGTSKEGTPVYLRDLFEVRRGYQNPIPYSVEVLRREPGSHQLSSARAVLLAVEMKEGNIIGRFNEAVRSVLDQVRGQLPEGIEILTLSDQPAAVAHRIVHFMTCFLEAVGIVVLVALFLMDWRSALVVAAAIPLTVAMTFGGMAVFGIPLHQISISSLIIALGMLVDDPVVASDGINRELARGQPRSVATWLGPFKLRHAILFATIINIVAFLPLVLLPGDKGAFIFALPVVVTLALVSSRIVSMTFVPLLAFYLLQGQKGLEAGGELRAFVLFRPIDRGLRAALPRYQHLLRAALARPGLTVAIAYSVLAASLGLQFFLGKQFFPPAERNQLLIDLELPESASLVQTRGVCQQVAELLKQQDAIVSAAIFSGGSAPQFYYNVVTREPASYLAQVLVNTTRAEDVPPLIIKLRAALDREIAGARCVVKQLEQGPPVEAPIQIRLTGDQLDTLRTKADEIARAVREANGYKVHDDLGRRTPALQIDIDQDRANTLAINNLQIGRLVAAAFSGLKVTEMREGDHLVPVVVRLRVEERNEADKIHTLYVRSLRERLVPLDNFASVKMKPEYATIAHFNKLRAVTVKAYSVFGELPSRVVQRARHAINRLELPPGYKLEYAGEAKELKKSQSEMIRVMQVSLALIALAMVLQFNSVAKSLVVMLTVPLGLIGALFGLAITRANLGFMALLAIVSLAGVIVSHIIVLSDFIEVARGRGMELKEALVQAGLVRLRAVLVTVLATVGGLVPLALTGGELWHPLTAVHIFGLLFATVLTLVLLPVLYYIFCAKLELIR